MSVFVYIVECADKTLYTGWTTDIARRVKAHNAGRGAKYTRERGPVRLVYIEEVSDRRVALKRELAIKRMSRAKKLKLIEAASILPFSPA
jgi:putative endonuclease